MATTRGREDTPIADSPPYPSPDPGEDAAPARGREPTTGAPRWVKVSGIITLVVVLLVAILLLAGGGDHGPGRHTSPGDAGGQAAPSSAVPEEAGGVGRHNAPAGGQTS
ncbi:MAG: hypothetical protein M3350_02830 [Actinomycetota bacterium]|nr:hypothetical protein [Actinomycetota bacterium]